MILMIEPSGASDQGARTVVEHSSTVLCAMSRDTRRYVPCMTHDPVRRFYIFQVKENSEGIRKRACEVMETRPAQRRALL